MSSWDRNSRNCLSLSRFLSAMISWTFYVFHYLFDVALERVLEGSHLLCFCHSLPNQHKDFWCLMVFSYLCIYGHLACVSPFNPTFTCWVDCILLSCSCLLPSSSVCHSSLIPFSEKSMKLKKSIKSQPVGYMCHADTCVLHEIRDE